MKILSLKLPDLLDQELSARAKRKGTTKSAIVSTPTLRHLVARRWL
jgi:predicted DNA-binding protein